MINSLVSSLARVTLTWYIIGILVFCLGDPMWAEEAHHRIVGFPGVTAFAMTGWTTAFKVQLSLLTYWTMPVLIAWVSFILGGALFAKFSVLFRKKTLAFGLAPTGVYWGVFVPKYSIGKLPQPTTPALTGNAVQFSTGFRFGSKSATLVEVKGPIKTAVGFLSSKERALAEELMQLLAVSPDHYAGLGHGVGLMEHTFNVLAEAASKCTADFRLPFLAALAHDIGKLITFQPDGEGGWVRKGLHSREGARILATLPAFSALPDLDQTALILAIKYDHAPTKMPFVRGAREPSMLALRVISALAAADRSATAGEKDRHLEKLKPEDLLWQDFIYFLREAPVVQKGKKGAANQVNNPPDSPFLFIYEAPWRDAAVKRLPAEVAAALDLTRRDTGKLAKYTRILAERLREEGLLVTDYQVRVKVGDQMEDQTLSVSEANPLWDIQSGTGDKAVMLRGIIVLHAEALWKALNYKLGQKSPYPVQILAPNADVRGVVNGAPAKNTEIPGPDVSDGLKVAEFDSKESMATMGLVDSLSISKPKARGRMASASAPADTFGLGLKPVKPLEVDQKPVAALAIEATPQAESEDSIMEQEMASAMAEPTAEHETPDITGVASADSSSEALALYASLVSEPAPAIATSEKLHEAYFVKFPAKVKQANVQAAAAQPNSNQPVRGKQATQPTSAPTAPSNNTPSALSLSRAESKEGLAIASEADCIKFPSLVVGDKYYTEDSNAVQTGLKAAGGKFMGAVKPKLIQPLISTGPKRGRIRPDK